jgi:cell division septum initiation protein DivIVA
VLVGASVGLAHSTYANYAEARQSFWEETLLPRNRRIIGALSRMFAADYDELQGDGTLEWDYSEVKALGENEDAKSTRVVEQFKAGLISRDEARDALGMDPLGGDAGDVYYLATGVLLVSAEGTPLGASATPPSLPNAPQSPPEAAEGTDTGAVVESVAGASRAPYRAFAADDSRTIPTALAAAVEDLQRQLAAAFTAEGEAFLRHLRSRRDALTESSWEELLRLAQAEVEALYSQALTDAAPAALERGWTDAGRGLTAALPAFGRTTPAVVGFLANYAADRVAGIQQTTRDRLRTLLADASASGWDYGRTARAITAAFDGFAGRATQEHLRNRAELIAVHEIGTAYEVGKSAVAAELRGSGIDIEKSWVTVNDDRVSAHCRDNAAQGWIPDTQMFPSGQMHAPAHPACRCATVRRVATKGRLTLRFPNGDLEVDLLEESSGPLPAYLAEIFAEAKR